MRILLTLSLLSCLIAAEPAVPVQLANDKAYADKVAAVLAEHPDGKNPQELFRWLWSYCSACTNNRDYAAAESAARALMALAPQYNLVHSDLSVILGKQGRYPEALQEAEIAKLLNPADSMHADAVACSWLYYLGRKQEAIERFQRIPLPTEAHMLGVYWGCRACFYATVGTVAEITSAIANALTSDPDQRAFFERDIVFDRYRGDSWFVGLVGKTLMEEKTSTAR